VAGKATKIPHRILGSKQMILGGVGILVVGGLVEGLRWQMFPAYLVFLIAAFFGATNLGAIWRGFLGLPLVSLLLLSGFLAWAMIFGEKFQAL
jgi:hypothetical protein